MSETAAVTPPPKCSELRKDGQPCTAFATATGKCAGHSRLGIGADPIAFARKGAEAAHAKQQQRAEARPKTLKDAMAARLEERADKIVARLEAIAMNGSDAASLSAIEQWTSRVYGKPTDHVETTVTVPAALEELTGMGPGERAELMRRLAGGQRLKLVAEQDESEAQAS